MYDDLYPKKKKESEVIADSFIEELTLHFREQELLDDLSFEEELIESMLYV